VAEPLAAEPVGGGIADFLPPAIGPVIDTAETEEAEAPRPRRTRRVRPKDNDEGVAPAA
jgi:hypothetical protein